jgi:hypothetical protein
VIEIRTSGQAHEGTCAAIDVLLVSAPSPRCAALRPGHTRNTSASQFGLQRALATLGSCALHRPGEPTKEEALMPMCAILDRRPFTSSPLAMLAAALAVFVADTPACAAEHVLMPSPQTVHIGHFDGSIKPALTIESGDTVDLVASDHLDPAVTDQSGVVAAERGAGIHARH